MTVHAAGPAKWIDVIVTTAEPGVATSDSGRRYLVTRDGGEHCAAIHDDAPRVACCLPPSHDLPHIAASSDLIDAGIRLASEPLPDV